MIVWIIAFVEPEIYINGGNGTPIFQYKGLLLEMLKFVLRHIEKEEQKGRQEDK